MEYSVKTIVFLTSVILTGLSAGFFYAWSVSVIPGNLKVADEVYLRTMQSINRAILNPAFFIVFFGSMVLLVANTFLKVQLNTVSFWLIVLSALLYVVGTFGVTGLGNVPLNNQLDALQLNNMPKEALGNFRLHFESNWNRLHFIRTVCSVASFIFILLGFMFYLRGN